METPREFDVAAVPGFLDVARALVSMARTRSWGHVTIRFQEGAIRAVDTLTTVKIDCGLDSSSERRAA